MVGAVYTYEYIPGFFIQDDKDADPAFILSICPNFGRLAPSWSDFDSKVSQLNATTENGTSHKVLILGRHGQGYHNVAIAKYGKVWEESWASLNGDGLITWGPDPVLTDLGKDQARLAHEAWVTELSNGLPLPHKFYCSPMTRALHTHSVTFDGILPAPGSDSKLTPVILENVREIYGHHTCDKRRPRSEIEKDFPDFVFEDGFVEDDELWTEERETYEHLDGRARKVLDRIFEVDTDATYVSIVAHNGMINAFLRVIGRGNFALGTGGIMMVVVKRTLQPTN